jgi:hypothetical protein
MLSPMTNHILLVMAVAEDEIHLERAQCYVDLARKVAGINQAVQLALDRRQAEIDEARATVAFYKFNVPNSN